MTPKIIESFRKDKVHGPGHGFGRNTGSVIKPVWVASRGIPMSSELIHSTNNSKKTSIEGEALFLCNSPDVSCHDLIAKNGDVYIILPEDALAWHSGAALAAFTNRHSFGTELHISIGEKPTEAQIESLTYRVQQRKAKYKTNIARIDTHRAVALPSGRKSDPEGWSDADFYHWRAGLYVAAEPNYAGLWGPYYAHFAGSGIEAAWRPYATVLRAATSDETTDAAGRVWRLFEGGAVSWKDGVTEVYLPKVKP